MSFHEQIKIFQTQQVRSAWDDEREQWYFSIVDIISVLTGSVNPTDYLKKMRKRDPELALFIGTNCPQVQMTTTTGRKRKTLAGTSEHIIRIIQNIPSKKAESLKSWLEEIDKEQFFSALPISSNIAIYSSEDGSVHLNVQLDKENVWLTQQQMATLFSRDRTVIGKHIANIYEEGELQKDITCANFAHMGTEGDQEYNPECYNLDVVISVGYRVHSIQGVRYP